MDCTLSIVKLKQAHQFLGEFTLKLTDSNEKYKELKQENHQYKARVASLEAEVLQLQTSFSQSIARESATQKKLQEKEALIDRLQDEIRQYDGQEARHSRESANYEDCIEQLETELKYALEKHNMEKYYAEENNRLRKTIQKMDAEMDELQTTMRIFSTGKGGSSITALTMEGALGTSVLNHMNGESAQIKDDFESVAHPTTITKGINYANSRTPKLMDATSLRKGYERAEILSDGLWPPADNDFAESPDRLTQPSVLQTCAAITVLKESGASSHSLANEWMTGLQEAALPLTEYNNRAVISIELANESDDGYSASVDSHSQSWDPACDTRRYVTLDSEERYNFRRTLHERRLKISSSSSSLAQSFNCVYDFSGETELPPDPSANQ